MACAQRVPVVHLAWLLHSVLAGTRLPLAPYLLPYATLDHYSVPLLLLYSSPPPYTFPNLAFTSPSTQVYPRLTSQRLPQRLLPFSSRARVGYGLRVEVVGFPEFRCALHVSFPASHPLT